ncbi:hypothetical protein D3C78_1651160 [compost metagenome]
MYAVGTDLSAISACTQSKAIDWSSKTRINHLHGFMLFTACPIIAGGQANKRRPIAGNVERRIQFLQRGVINGA